MVDPRNVPSEEPASALPPGPPIEAPPDPVEPPGCPAYDILIAAAQEIVAVLDDVEFEAAKGKPHPNAVFHQQPSPVQLVTRRSGNRVILVACIIPAPLLSQLRLCLNAARQIPIATATAEELDALKPTSPVGLAEEAN
jgi:hypothetical protein